VKLFFSIILTCLLGFSYGQKTYTLYIYGSVPDFDPEVKAALTDYKLSFKDTDEPGLHENFYTYAILDSVYGSNWLDKLNKKLKDNEVWNKFIKNSEKADIYIDNWNYTKIKFYSVGLIKETETQFCAYDLRCAKKFRHYSRKGKVTKEKFVKGKSRE
jgi:hypothetical protein